MSYTYLASPYSHPDPFVRGRRYDEAMRATAWLLDQRVWVYSPIVHCHELARRFQRRFDFEFWRDYNMAMLDQADRLLILAIDGWQESKGVQGEVDRAWQRPIPIQFIMPEHTGQFVYEPVSPNLFIQCKFNPTQ